MGPVTRIDSLSCGLVLNFAIKSSFSKSLLTSFKFTSILFLGISRVGWRNTMLLFIKSKERDFLAPTRTGLGMKEVAVAVAVAL